MVFFFREYMRFLLEVWVNQDRRDRDRIVVDLQLPVQSVPITANYLSSNTA